MPPALPLPVVPVDGEAVVLGVVALLVDAPGVVVSAVRRSQPISAALIAAVANMALDSATAELGWKANDEPKGGPVHRLATNDPTDLDGAFRTLLLKKKQSRRREVFMEIIHLVLTML